MRSSELEEFRFDVSADLDAEVGIEDRVRTLLKCLRRITGGKVVEEVNELLYDAFAP